MFLVKERYLFLASIVLIIVAYACMIVDPVDYGFGILTLWIAPLLLLTGLFLPIVGILGFQFNYRDYLRNAIKKSTIKHSVGFGVFAIALITYSVTLEPTASLWDCSEFIASAYKLQVPHSPGGPLFLLMGRIFTMLALGDTTKVAWTVNMSSALFSALTVYIVFHFIYYFGNRLVSVSDNSRPILIFSALCGSLCLTFSDTFWFSAVEAETYAAASFFLILISWLIITGNDFAEETRSRRLILIFYLAGLSYCVHPMCLLALPLLPFYWYNKHGKIGILNFFLTVGFGLAIVLLINRVIAVGLFELMFSIDLFFVNTLHAPFYSGVWVLIFILVLMFIFLLRQYKAYIQYCWAVIFLLVGFLPYVMIFIRSNFNPPIDETNPENLPLIKAYMNRESYGSVPLLYGPYFDAEISAIEATQKMFYKDSTAYHVAGTTSVYRYDEKRQTIFPRMYSNNENNVAVYRQWTGLKNNEKPTFVDNLTFMFRFQLGEMYLRYFMFNFAGRESDVQYSPWLRPWDQLNISVLNRARNQYWMIPLLLGFIGTLFHYYKNRKDFFSVFLLFLITGIVLVLYLNSPPNEPRERDYIYVGSFIAYCIWIGLGVSAIGNYGLKYKKILYALPFISLGVPGWMAYQNIDDHNRSGRTFQIDNARNLLQSCAPNSILFTGGDNDTFPLWYLQEIENFRTDVRVMVLSYLNTDWYINQLRRTYYNSQAFKLSLNKKDYLQYGPNDVLYVQESIKAGINAEKFIQLLNNEHPGLRMKAANGEVYSILPSSLLRIPVNEADLVEKFHSKGDTSLDSVHEMGLRVIGNFLPKGALSIVDLIVSNNWQRPIYFNFTSLNQIELDITPYLVQEGLVYRLTPYENKSNDILLDTDRMYQNLIAAAHYENLLRTDVYFNHEDFHLRMIDPLRSSINSLAIGLLNEGDEKKAIDVLEYAIRTVYPSHLKPSVSNLQAAEILLSVGKQLLAEKLAVEIFESSFVQVKTSLEKDQPVDNLSAYLLQRSEAILSRMGHKEHKTKLDGLNLFD